MKWEFRTEKYNNQKTKNKKLNGQAQQQNGEDRGKNQRTNLKIEQQKLPDPNREKIEWKKRCSSRTHGTIAKDRTFVSFGVLEGEEKESRAGTNSRRNND